MNRILKLRMLRTNGAQSLGGRAVIIATIPGRTIDAAGVKKNSSETTRCANDFHPPEQAMPWVTWRSNEHGGTK